METSALLTSLAALGVVIALILGAQVLIQRYGTEKLAARFQRPGKRLQVQEILVLDRGHKLALIQQDNTEHLLLLGHQHATVVYSRPMQGETPHA